MGRIEDLVHRYHSHISAPWPKNLTGAERTAFVVYDKTDERKIRAKLGLFEEATHRTGRTWRAFDFTPIFPRWFAAIDPEQRSIYFEEPESLTLSLDPDRNPNSDFTRFAAEQLGAVLTDPAVTENTVVAVYGLATLYGFTRVSAVLDRVRLQIRGHLLVLFPGSWENNNYRLLDARDGWNYLAIPITSYNGLHDS
jgi:hypothetical protein